MARVKADASAVIERHGGTVNQFVGDEIMALFGIPVARRDDARRAVAAALELHAVVDAYLADARAGVRRAAWRCTPASPPAWSWPGAATPAPATSRSPATRSTRPPACAALAASREVVVSATTWQQVSDAFDAEATAPLAAQGQGPAARRLPHPRRAQGTGRRRDGRWSAATRSCATSAPLAEACAQRRRSRVVDRPRRPRRRQVAPGRRVRRDRRATLGFSCHGAPVLDFGAETGRDAVRSLARSLLGVDGAADEATRRTAIERASRGPADGRRSSSLFLLRPARRRRRRPSCARSPRR